MHNAKEPVRETRLALLRLLISASSLPGCALIHGDGAHTTPCQYPIKASKGSTH